MSVMRGAGWRNDPNNVCTCEQMNNNKKNVCKMYFTKFAVLPEEGTSELICNN
jgi:hypothetical protein